MESIEYFKIQREVEKDRWTTLYSLKSKSEAVELAKSVKVMPDYKLRLLRIKEETEEIKI